MAHTSLFFHLHHPLPLQPYTLFQVGTHQPYFDEAFSACYFDKLVDHTLRPWTSWLEQMGQQHGERFRVALCVSGVTLERLEAQNPALLSRWQTLVQQGTLSWVGTTYYASLSFLYGRGEFMRQVQLHREKLFALGGTQVTAFYHPGGIYGNPLAFLLERLGFRSLYTEGRGPWQEARNAQYLCHPAHLSHPRLLLRNPAFSDAWHVWPGQVLPQPQELAQHLSEAEGQLSLLTLDLHRLPFGQQGSLWTHWVEAFLRRPGQRLVGPAELTTWEAEGGHLDAADFISSLGPEHDLSPWQGNPMQQESLEKLYWLEGQVQAWQDEEAIRTWSLLQQSSHLLAMGPHLAQSLSPFATPHAAYLAFMNVLADWQLKLGVTVG